MIRELGRSEMETLLAAHQHAHLGCCDGDQPYVVPVSYVFENGAFFSYTHDGRKTAILRANPRVCIQVDDLSAGQWRSIVVEGAYEELAGDERHRATKLLGSRIKKIRNHLPFLPEDVVPSGTDADEKEVVIYRVAVVSMTGRAFGNMGETFKT